MQDYRFEMNGYVKGRFALRPERSFELNLTSLDFSGGRLTIGGEPTLQSLLGEASCAVDPFDPRFVEGYDFLHFISCTLIPQGEFAGVAFLRPHLPGVWVSGGRVRWNSRSASTTVTSSKARE